MSGSVRPPRPQPVPPPDASLPGKKHKNKHREKDDSTFFNLDQAASATECTGLLAAQVQNEEEAESLSDLEGIHAIQPPHQAKPEE